MRFIVDAQLPRRLSLFLGSSGHDSIHTLDLPNSNHSKDHQIADIADQEDRIVITKDSDFAYSHLFQGRPTKLLLISTGNLRNHALLDLFSQRLYELDIAFREADFVEMSLTALILHG